MRTVDPGHFRSVMGNFATGVTVITATAGSGPVGMTANAVASLSLEPLLLLVAFDNTARTLQVVRETERFGVNVLGAGQEELARLFASKAPEDAKFAGVPHTLEPAADPRDRAVDDRLHPERSARGRPRHAEDRGLGLLRQRQRVCRRTADVHDDADRSPGSHRLLPLARGSSVAPTRVIPSTFTTIRCRCSLMKAIAALRRNWARSISPRYL